MILIIDNYDSFVYNLARYVECLGESTKVIRNDAISIDEIKKLSPRALIISPGPCAPQQSGICIDLIRALGKTTPILGVCLGHQAIGEAYGGQTVRALEPVHGKATAITHDSKNLFQNLPSPMVVGRYHSLVTTFPENTDLLVTAFSENHEIMGLQHKLYPVYGIQFHPESILTPDGMEILKNFLLLAKNWYIDQEKIHNKDTSPHE